MAESCVLVPKVKNKKNNELVDSKLWTDLYKATNKDRGRTLDLYKVATSDEFLNAARAEEEIKYDENGQITAHSFLKLIDAKAELTEEVKALNKKYERLVDTDKVGDVVAEFNSEQLKDEYVPSVKREGNSYRVTLTARNEQNVEELQRTIENSRLSSAIVNSLKSIGVAYDFVNDISFNGMVDTTDAHTMADGLAHLVKLSSGTADVKDALTEEAAHIAVLATRDKVLTQRLIDAVSDLKRRGMLERVFSKEEIDMANLNPEMFDMELAGVLVKKSMMNLRPTRFGELIGRVKSLIYKLFSKIGLTDLLRECNAAKAYAQSIANGFLFNPEQFKLNNVALEPIKLYSLMQENPNLRYVSSTIKELTSFVNTVRQAGDKYIQSDFFQKIRPENILSEADEKMAEIGIATATTTTAIESLYEIFDAAYDKVERAVNSPDYDAMDISKADADNTMIAIEAYSTIEGIIKNFQSMISTMKKEEIPIEVAECQYKIAELQKKMNDNSKKARLLDVARTQTAAIMTFVYGRTQSEMPAHMILNNLKSMTVKEGGIVKYKELASSYFDDFTYKPTLLSCLSSYIRAHKYSKDVMTQVMDRFARRGRSDAMLRRNEKLEELYAIEKELKESGYKDSDFYEKVAAPPVVTVVDHKGEKWYALNGKAVMPVTKIVGYKWDESTDSWGIKHTDYYIPVVYESDGVWCLDGHYTKMKADTNNKINGRFFISEVNRTQFHIDENIEYRKLKSRFLKDLQLGKLLTAKGDFITKEDFDKLTAAKKRAIFKEYQDKDAEWNYFLDEAYEDRAEGILSDKYLNEDYARLSKDKKWLDVYEKIKAYKMDVDNTCLYERDDFTSIDEEHSGSRHFVNMKRPQYKKSFIGKYWSHRLDQADLYSGESERYLCESVTSEEFGSPATENKPTFLTDPVNLYDESLRRLPLSGINDVKDVRELSDNLIAGLAAYTDMAYKYYGAQRVFSALSVIDIAAENRDELGDNRASKSRIDYVHDTVKKERMNIMDTYIFANADRNKGTLGWFFKKAIGLLGNIVSVSILCVEPVKALKNKFGGLTVLSKDALAGTYGFDVSSLTKSWAGDTLNPKHWLGTAASVATDSDISFDRYAKLTKRFDVFRNPATRIKRGRYNLFSHLENVLMANYSVTDTSLLATIYRTFLRSRYVYDENGDRHNLMDTYGYDVDDNPYLKDGFVKERKNSGYYRLLVQVKNALEEIIENNEDGSNIVKLARTDAKYGDIFMEFAKYVNEHKDETGNDAADINKNIAVNDSSAASAIDLIERSDYKLLSLVKSDLEKISYTSDDEQRLILEMDDYVCISQGYYGSLNASMLQGMLVGKEFSRMKGWLYAFVQRDFLETTSLAENRYKHSLFGTYALAFFSLLPWVKRKDESGDNISKTWHDEARLKAATLAAMTLPFINKNKKYVKYMTDNGWDPDQLSNLAFGLMGFIINELIRKLCTLFSRGNLISAGKANSKFDTQGKEYVQPGIFGDFYDTESGKERATEAKQKWAEYGYPIRGNKKKKTNIDDEETLDKPSVDTFSELLPIKADAGDIYYVRDRHVHYKYYDSNRFKGWKVYEMGYYDPDTTEGSNAIAYRERAIDYANYLYDRDNPMYYVNGFMYRLLRGVASEASTINDPFAMINELSGFFNMVIMNGVTLLTDGVEAFTNPDDSDDDYFERLDLKQIRNILNKSGLFDLDGAGETICRTTIHGEPHRITLLDHYNKNAKAENYKKRTRFLPRREDELLKYD